MPIVNFVFPSIEAFWRYLKPPFFAEFRSYDPIKYKDSEDSPNNAGTPLIETGIHIP